jgi:hypothetical protein
VSKYGTRPGAFGWYGVLGGKNRDSYSAVQCSAVQCSTGNLATTGGRMDGRTDGDVDETDKNSWSPNTNGMIGRARDRRLVC